MKPGLYVSKRGILFHVNFHGSKLLGEKYLRYTAWQQNKNC